MSEPGTARDPLYEAAFRLARLYAILSPRVLTRELKVDRERAESLLAELEREGAVGPTVIKGTGARESLVNIVQDEPSGDRPPALASNPGVGRRTVAVAFLASAIGLGFVALLTWVRIGDQLNRWLLVELGSPIIAAVIRAGLPSIGLLGGYLVELPLRRDEDFAPYWAVRMHGWIWSGATLAVVILALLRLLS